jgi:hypothetical protein
MLGSSSVAAQLSASQEGLSSMKLVSAYSLYNRQSPSVLPCNLKLRVFEKTAKTKFVPLACNPLGKIINFGFT